MLAISDCAARPGYTQDTSLMPVLPAAPSLRPLISSMLAPLLKVSGRSMPCPCAAAPSGPGIVRYTGSTNESQHVRSARAPLLTGQGFNPALCLGSSKSTAGRISQFRCHESEIPSPILSHSKTYTQEVLEQERNATINSYSKGNHCTISRIEKP